MEIHYPQTQQKESWMENTSNQSTLIEIEKRLQIAV